MSRTGAHVVIGPGRVVTSTGWFTGTVHLAGGRISEIRAAPDAAPDEIIAPGFVDVQVNGIDDVDVALADGADWERTDELLASTGVTSWMPTLTTRPLRDYAAPLARIERASNRTGSRPRIVGAHLEGPFLGSLPGAHPPEAIIPVDIEWLRALPTTVRMMTLGPEQADARDAIGLLAGRGVVVSLGHSTADADATSSAIEAGATMATHLFNAMGPLHHRAPGLAGVALTDTRVHAGLIADLVHVDAIMLRLAFLAKGPERIVLVTDAVGWRAPHLARGGVAVVDGAPRLPDGTIAGSALTMDQAVRNVVDHARVPPDDALRAASTTPARVLREPDLGRITVGAPADLVVLGADDLSVRRTIVGGDTVWEC